MTLDAQKTYREQAVRSATQVQLVMMMYDMIGQDLRRAIDAIHRNDVEARSVEIKHALAVLEQLQGTLNMQAGGDAARCLDRLYSTARGKLLEAHIKVSEEMLRSQMRIFADLREAWHTCDEEVRRTSIREEQMEAIAVIGNAAVTGMAAPVVTSSRWSA